MQFKYSYDNWWNGEVTLVYSTRMYLKGNAPKLADWDDFSQSDVERIKEKQREIYAEKVNSLLKTYCDQFNKRLYASEMKNEYFNDEIQECKKIMFGIFPNTKLIHLMHWGIAHDHQYLLDIQYYIDRTIKKGIDDGLDFIHSPKCEYEDKFKPDSRIYARFVWEYLQWLESLIEKECKSEIPNDESIHISEPKNKYPSIFKNGYSYAMFLELKDLIVKPKSIISDFGFIFHKFKRCGYILSEVKHKSFIYILRRDFDADIPVDKLPFKNQVANITVFSTILTKYKHLIEGEE